MTIEKNIVILTEGSEELMQGIIRGIEALDKNHQIGIIYGQYDHPEMTEAEAILVDLTNSVIVKTPHMKAIAPAGKEVESIDLSFTEDIYNANRDTIIEYIKDNYDYLISEILK